MVTVHFLKLKNLSMNWEKNFPFGKWNEPIGNSAHATGCLANRPSKYTFLAYVYG